MDEIDAGQVDSIATLDRLESTTLADKALTSLREAILAGEIPPGERLVETDLSRQFGVSRGVVREALNVLVGEGLVTSPPHRGSRVVELDGKRMLEAYEVRFAFESLAVIKLCGNITSRQESALRELLAQMQTAEARGDERALGNLDMSFHEKLVEFSGNSRLVQGWRRLKNEMTLYFVAFPRQHPHDSFPDRHERLLDAITSGDVRMALETLAEHIGRASRILPDGVLGIRLDLFGPK
jgi:DNA-binding GntR family transcriptional regulator